ncbi:hypothetical protein RIF29_17976 [Crotalaria pallida]|uniref:Uncharacterized protein n=1 Tax=Crotalaria pallida TaxID=3830 RepID=A0AAN9FJ29_CROPI
MVNIIMLSQQNEKREFNGSHFSLLTHSLFPHTLSTQNLCGYGPHNHLSSQPHSLSVQHHAPHPLHPPSLHFHLSHPLGLKSTTHEDKGKEGTHPHSLLVPPCLLLINAIFQQ